MEIIIHPLSMFSRQIAQGLPQYFQTFPAILMLIYSTYLVGKKGNGFDLRFGVGIVFFVILLLFTQAIASLRTILSFPITGVGIFDKYVQFILLIIYITLAYFFMKNALDTEQRIVNFFKGVYLTCAFILLIVFAQLAFIQFGWFYSILYWLREVFGQDAYSDANNLYLIRGGVEYLRSFRQPNGLDPESRDVAIRLALTCLPFMLAAFRNRLSFKGSTRLGNTIHTLSILLTVFALFFLATATGYAIGMLTAIIFVLFVLKPRVEKSQSVKKIIVLIVFAMSVLLLFMYFGTIQVFFTNYFFAREGSGNRRASAIALWRTFIQHPLIGVGFDFSSPWNILNAPANWANNPVNIHIYLASGTLPALSVFLGWLAELGLVAILPILGYFLRVKIDFTMLVERLEKTNVSTWQKKFYSTINDAYFLFIIYFIPVSFLLFDWEGLSYILVVMFFIVTKAYLLNLLETIAPIGEKGEEV